MGRSTLTFKVIKPKRMKTEPYAELIKKAVQAEAKLHRRELEKTTATWKGKPTFGQQTNTRGGDLIVTVGTKGSSKANQIWNWINEGTKAYTIRAKNAPALRFKVNYTAATKPGFFGSYPSGSWPPWRRPKSVRHPGIKARDWTTILSEKRQGPFEKRILKALKEASKQTF